MKIKILYSHIHTQGTSDNKARPFWFSFEKCFQNFKDSLQSKNNIYGIDYEFHVIYDISKGKLEQNWLYKYTADNFIIHQIQGGTMEKAAIEMYKIAKELSINMKDDDLFYFVENDYLHIKGWLDKVKELFGTYGLNGGYVSLYDHPDKYISQIYPNLLCQLISTETHHWRTTPSTCGSFVVNKKIFLEDFEILTTIMGDHNKWLHLAEQKDRFVLTSIPTLSTHCMEQHLANCVNWKEVNGK